jgi:hypothetical protein
MRNSELVRRKGVANRITTLGWRDRYRGEGNDDFKIKASAKISSGADDNQLRSKERDGQVADNDAVIEVRKSERSRSHK